MNILQNIKLRSFLLIISGLWILGFVVLGILSINSMLTIEKEIQNFTKNTLPLAASISEINKQLAVQSGMVLETKGNESEIFQGVSKKILAEIENIEENLLTQEKGAQKERAATLKEVAGLIEEFKNSYVLFERDAEAYLKPFEGGSVKAVGSEASRLEGRAQALMAIMNDADSKVKTIYHGSSQMMQEAVAAEKTELALITIVVLSTACLFTLFAFKAVNSKLKGVQKAIEAIATGDADLTKRVEVEGKTEVDEIASLLNTFIHRMQEMIKEIREYGLQVSAGAREVGELASCLASTAVEGNAQSEEVAKCANDTGEQMSSIAAALEEMTATVSEIAQHTAVTSQKSGEVAEKTKDAQQMVESLEEASLSIDEMSSLIGNIAEQTNLLALNATIEAARAGEAGKGFAVVANEVKELAQQTGEAVKKIDSNVNELKVRIERVKRVTGEIVLAIDEVNELANNVAAAVEEQTATTNEISQGAQSVSNNTGLLVTQSEGIREASIQTAAGSEQAKSSASELATTAKDLENTLLAFKV